MRYASESAFFADMGRSISKPERQVFNQAWYVRYSDPDELRALCDELLYQSDLPHAVMFADHFERLIIRARLKMANLTADLIVSGLMIDSELPDWGYLRLRLKDGDVAPVVRGRVCCSRSR